MTCHMSTSALKYPHNDWLMYVLYHDDVRLMGQIIDSGCASLKATYPQPRLGALIDSFRVDPRECVNVVRVKMLIMFELDESTRANICSFKPAHVMERKPVCPVKASSFFQELHDALFPQWVCDERQSLDDFIDSVRMCYLVS